MFRHGVAQMREQRIPRPIAEVFAFFADAHNLEAITPPWLRFRILRVSEGEIRQGTLIDYALRLHGIPLRWRTEITEWAPPHRFVDSQISGPYRLWHHEHTFSPDGENATTMRDRVTYRLPFGVLGRGVHALMVRRDVAKIFDYRAEYIAEAFGSSRTLA
jgi:ligand-binding SRPBCC domain-containing protein